MKALLVILYVILFSDFFIAQNYADKDYYLIDSLDLASLTKNDSVELEKSLERFYETTDDSIKIMAIRRAVKLCHEEKVWLRYNDWIENRVNSDIKLNISNNFKSSTLAFVFNNKAYYERGKGNIALALELSLQSLSLQIKAKDTQGQTNSYYNIAGIYKSQGDIDLALENYFKILKVSKDYITHQNEDVKDGKYNYKSEALVYAYNNIGLIYFEKDSLVLSERYFIRALQLEEEFYHKKGIVYTSALLGDLYLKMNMLGKALKKLTISLEIAESIDYKKGIVKANKSLGDLYLASDNTSEAKKRYLNSFSLAKEIHNPYLIETTAMPLYLLYEQQGNKAEAFEFYKLYIKMRDSIYNKETQRNIINQQIQFEYEKKKAVDDATYSKELAIKEKEKENQQLLTFLFIGLAIVVFLISLIIYNRLKVVKRKNSIIEEQKRMVKKAHFILEEKNKEIIDSINYAKRIQSAILPPQKQIDELLGDNFVLYKPKDIVAGDFYWVDKVNDQLFFAVADCTGHGVPGAMVSVVCNSGLNRSLKEYAILKPNLILDKTRQIVIEEFSRSGEEVKDGMDIALCSINGNELNYAGANNSLWIIRKGSSEVHEIKADKQPVGLYHKPTNFNEHKISLDEGDLVYLFSDGFADQFGGEKNKKFKTVNFKKLLISLSKLPLPDQKIGLDVAFEKWRGELEQLDDVCVMGYKHNKA
jgi:serine phosphatase RsbU (regulator of sigma subunit)